MWIITKDFGFDPEFDEKPDVGVRSVDCSWDVDVNDIKAIKKLMPYRFRTLNDDDGVDYEGYCSSNDDDRAFDPLDDFCMPNVGSTSIQYWVTGKGGGWETL